MNFIYFLGRFHVLLLHVPITLVLVSVTFDWLSRKDRFRAYAPVVQPLWAATAVSAVFTAVLGYMHFSEGGFSGPSALAHRALGTSVALVTILIWLFRGRSFNRYYGLQGPSSVIVVLLVVATGHFGGNLTHGDTYLVQYAPDSIQKLLGLQQSRPPINDISMADPFLDIVRPIFQQRCFGCHNDDKRRGELSLATYASVIKGGKDGPVIAAGKSQESDMYRRITLSARDKNAMPAEGKTPLTDGQKTIIRWWIDSGAKSNAALGHVSIPTDVLMAINVQLGLANPSSTANAAGADSTTEETIGPPVKVSAQIMDRLTAAGFMARQSTLSDVNLVVSTVSPGNRFVDQQLETLATSRAQISELDIERAGLTDSAIPVIAKLQGLTRLRLDNDKITDKGLRSLVTLKKLQYLNLYGNSGITDASLELISQLPDLQEIFVWGTAITPAGVARLKQLRPTIFIDAGDETSPVTPVGAATEPAKAASNLRQQ